MILLPRKSVAFFLLLLCLLFWSPPTVEASFFDDLKKGIESLFPGKTKKSIDIHSDIVLAPNGDKDQNGEINGGDIIRISYIITNSTGDDIEFASVNTNFTRKQINFIHNVRNTTGIINNEDEIIIPDISLLKGQSTNISFDARVNYFINEDVSVSTEPVISSESKEILSKGEKITKEAKRITNIKVLKAVQGIKVKDK